MVASRTCVHGRGALYVDADGDTRCRECGRSVSFPARKPQREERQQHRMAPIANTPLTVQEREWLGLDGEPEPEPEPIQPTIAVCLQCRATTTVKDTGPVICQCGIEILHVGIDGNHRLPDFDPPRSLRCSCCKEHKPQFCFGGATSNTYREGRANQCRGCTAFQRRVRRQQRGPEVTERDRLRAKEYRAGLTPEQKAKYRVSEKAHNASRRRWYARKVQGRAVPKQRAGRIPLLVKPMCRIAASCPLRKFCTVESKGIS